MADSIGKQFDGLPIGALVCSPLIEVAKGQEALVNTYVKGIRSLAFKNPDKHDDPTPNMLSFEYDKEVVNEDGTSTTQKMSISAPVLALVPVPAFLMNEASVKFTMEVKSQEAHKDTDKKEIGGTVGFSGWGVTASITGSVATSSENTRSTDQSAKYEISAKAIQMPPAEGMSKLTDLFASIITPVQVNGKYKILLKSITDRNPKKREIIFSDNISDTGELNYSYFDGTPTPKEDLINITSYPSLQKKLENSTGSGSRFLKLDADRLISIKSEILEIDDIIGKIKV